MTIEYGMKDGVLLWVRSPFDGTVTYFDDIHRKPHAFRHLTRPQHVPATPPPLAHPSSDTVHNWNQSSGGLMKPFTRVESANGERLKVIGM